MTGERSDGRSEEAAASAARRRASPDPLGKRALFWVPGTQAATSGPGARPARTPPLGKRALFSDAGTPVTADGAVPAENPVGRRGAVTVVCGSCNAVSRIGLLDLLIFQFPIGVWVPGRRFDHRMTCPSCRRRVWASVTLNRG
jgi:hypothetical protein